MINEVIRLCGYFVIITSEKMSAADALDLCKSRDASEKIFVEFIALILMNRIHTYLRKQRIANGNKQNYMNTPAAVIEKES